MDNNSLEDILSESGNGMNYNPINENNDFNGNLNNGGTTRKPPRPKKSKKPILIIIMLLLLIVIAIVVVILLLLDKTEEVSDKMKFFEYLGKNNVEEVFELDAYNDLNQKMFEENYSVNTQVEISAKTDDLEIDGIDLIIDSERDNENGKAHAKAALNYSDNELLNLELLMTDEAVGIKSEGITDGYLGMSYDYLLENIVVDENSDFDMTALLGMFNEDTMKKLATLEIPTISKASLDMYKKAFDKELDEAKFTSKKVTLTRDSGNIKATEYSLKLSSKELTNLVKTFLRTFETDTETIASLESFLSLFGVTGTDVATLAELMAQSLEANELETSSQMVTIKLYESKEKLVKMLIESDGIDTLEIEFDNTDSESSIKLTQVDDSQTGSVITFKNPSSDLVKKFVMEVSSVEYGEIVTTATIESSVVDSGNSYTMNNDISCQYDGGTVDVKIVSKVNFEDVTVDDLTPVNCTFVDDLSEEELQVQMNKISENAQKVITEKLMELSFIDSNNPPTFIEQNPNGGEENPAEKAEAKDALYNALVEIVNANGENIALESFENIEIPGYEVSAALRDDMVVVTVNDFVFYISYDENGGLQLSE